MAADDDIVVGDTIIFTERLYVDRDGNLVQQGQHTIPPLVSVPSPSSAFSNEKFPNGASGGGVPRVSLGAANVGPDGGRRGGGRRGGGVPAGIAPVGGNPYGGAFTHSAFGGKFVGERTAAAHVLHDSFRLMKRREGGGVLEYKRFEKGVL